MKVRDGIRVPTAPAAEELRKTTGSEVSQLRQPDAPALSDPLLFTPREAGGHHHTLTLGRRLNGTSPLADTLRTALEKARLSDASAQPAAKNEALAVAAAFLGLHGVRTTRTAEG